MFTAKKLQRSQTEDVKTQEEQNEQTATQSAVDLINSRDYLAILLKLDFAEQIVFSRTIKKINSFGISQSRNFVLTNQSLCHFKNAELKRAVNLYKVQGITLSTSRSKEFVVHVQDEHDYRFRSDARGEIVDAVKKCYYQKTQRNLPIYEVPAAVKPYAQSRMDSRIGTQKRVPDEEFRLQCDIVEPPKPVKARALAFAFGHRRVKSFSGSPSGYFDGDSKGSRA